MIAFRFDDARLPARFWSKVAPEPNSGCWLWTAALNTHGYGTFGVDARPRMSHRYAYEVFVGPIPGGFVVDHLCGVKECCNPAHLEAVTLGENVRRAHARRTHCAQGHPFTGDNLIVSTRQRQCRECMRKASREYQRRRRAAHRVH